MATEYTDELNNSVLEALRRKIEEQRLSQQAQAKGEAISRGLSGSTFEATRLALADKYAANASADAAVNLAVAQAERAREERLARESREFQAGESQKARDYQSAQEKLQRDYATLENEKQRAFQAGENERAQAIAQEQARLEREAQDRANNTQLLASGIGAGASLLGKVFAPKAAGVLGAASPIGSSFGLGVPGLTGAAGLPVGSTIGGTGAAAGLGTIGLGALGAGALYGIGSGTGQLLGKGVFKSLAAQTAARKGAQIGAFAGPLGGAIGALAGGLSQKAGKLAKKIFCFDRNTPILLNDWQTTTPISELEIGMETLGGTVESIRKAVSDDKLYEYKGIKVTGNHAVLENGEWKRVKNSMFALPLPDRAIVWSIATTKHRIYVPTVGGGLLTFADELETDFYEYLDIDQSLQYLNGEQICGTYTGAIYGK